MLQPDHIQRYALSLSKEQIVRVHANYRMSRIACRVVDLTPGCKSSFTPSQKLH